MQRKGFVIKTSSFWYLWCDLSAQTQTSSAILGAHVTIGYLAGATATISAKQNRKPFCPHPVFATLQVSQRSGYFRAT